MCIMLHYIPFDLITPPQSVGRGLRVLVNGLSKHKVA
jgi:hypothetical protein